MLRTLTLFVLLLAATRVAAAEPASQTAATVRSPQAPDRLARPGGRWPKHAIYAELMGKGGLDSLGYDYAFIPHLAAGAALSAYWLHGQRVLSLSPYLGLYPRVHGNHAWFAHGGFQVVDLAISSPVPQRPGERSTRVGGQLASSSGRFA